MRIKAPKTKRGRRTISIPPSLVAELRAHRKAQEEIWLRLGLGKVKDESLVFTTWYGEPRTPHCRRDWSETMADFGLKVTLHSLRHSHASALIAAAWTL